MTTIENPARPEVQAIFLKAHLKLHALGMKARGVRGGDLLKKAGVITGQTYKRGEYRRAFDDLKTYIENATRPA
jgi:hypothetical protein